MPSNLTVHFARNLIAIIQEFRDDQIQLVPVPQELGFNIQAIRTSKQNWGHASGIQDTDNTERPMEILTMTEYCVFLGQLNEKRIL